MRNSRVVLRGVQGLVGGGLAGSVVGAMTVGLNQHLPWIDVAFLLLWMALPSALMVGMLATLGTFVIRRFRTASHRSTDKVVGSTKGAPDPRFDWTASLLLGGPTGATLALPDLGLSGEVVSNAVLGRQPGDLAVFAIVLAVLIAVCAVVVRVALHQLWSTTGSRSRRLSKCVLLASLVALPWLISNTVASIAHRPSLAARSGSQLQTSFEDGVAPAKRSELVVLLNIDGLDPAVIEELGPEELPFLWSFREAGVTGPLATEVPTLSPPIWTTMVTGTSRRVHGVRGFLYFQLPGLRKPIWEFPLHSGLNFTLVPWLERTLGLSDLTVPYRSDHRTVPAVWEVLEGAAAIGVYRWRTTWPVERTATMMAAERVHQQLEEFGTVKRRRTADWLWPSNLLDELTIPDRGEGVDLVKRLVELIEKYELDLMIAALSSVDGVQHRFGLQWSKEGEGRRRIVDRYKQQDRRLSALYDALGPQTDLIVVSDHGFSFEHGHHAQAPPGVFLARGPSFRPGLEAEDLSIYDIAPLLIDMFGVPLSRELPGTLRLHHRTVLHSPSPLKTVERYRPRVRGKSLEMPDADTEAMKEQLRALGYIQ